MHRVQGDGAPLVLIPGGLTDYQSLDPLVPKLAAQGYRVITVQPIANDRGGSGQAGVDDYDAEVERESLRLTVEATAPGQAVHVVGWSNGARAALAFAAGHPDRVTSVVAVEPPMMWLLPDDPGARELRQLVDALHGKHVDEDHLQTFLANVRVAPEGTDYRSLPQWPAWSQVRQTLSWYGQRVTGSAQAQLEDLESIHVPVLLLRGTWTAPWLRGVVDLLAERLPDARVRDLEGGHACLLQSADDFVAAVDEHARAYA